MKKLLLITILLLIALLLAVPASAGSDTTQVRGVVPFAISGVSAVDITSTGATITWLTNGASDSRVLYDTVSHPTEAGYAYTSSSSTQVTSHSVTLSNLTADKTYYYRVKSIASGGATAVSGEYSFKTAASSGGGSSGGGGGGGGDFTSSISSFTLS